jgi:hypothetical protein
MKKLNIYGIKTITLNDVVVHTFKIRVRNTNFNSNTLRQHGFIFNPNDKYLVVTETTVDSTFFNNQVSKLGKALKTIAINNVEEKYQWVSQTTLNI